MNPIDYIVIQELLGSIAMANVCRNAPYENMLDFYSRSGLTAAQIAGVKKYESL